MTIFNNTHVASESINYNKSGEGATIEISLMAARQKTTFNFQQSTINNHQSSGSNRSDSNGSSELEGYPFWVTPRITNALQHSTLNVLMLLTIISY